MEVNKDEALRQWLTGFTSFVGFDILSDSAGSYAVFLDSGAVLTDFISNEYEQRYTDFTILAMLAISDLDPGDGTNTSNTDYMRQWQNWIKLQEKNRNYPDFGDNCSSYELKVISENPYMAAKYESGTAKYQFTARLEYIERNVN